MEKLMRFPNAMRRDPKVETWLSESGDELRRLTQPWFERMRDCGPDVLEVLADGHPTASASDAAFGYVATFSAHADVGLFHGAALDDPVGLLVGSGKRMRHVKLSWGRPIDEAALAALVIQAYREIQRRLQVSHDEAAR